MASTITRNRIVRSLSSSVRHYNEEELASLLLSISTINVWNRLNASVKMVAGSTNEHPVLTSAALPAPCVGPYWLA